MAWFLPQSVELYRKNNFKIRISLKIPISMPDSPGLGRPTPWAAWSWQCRPCVPPHPPCRGGGSWGWSGNLWVWVIVKSWANLLTWLLNGCSCFCSQSRASLLVDPTNDKDYNSQNSIPGKLLHRRLEGHHLRPFWNGAVARRRQNDAVSETTWTGIS